MLFFKFIFKNIYTFFNDKFYRRFLFFLLVLGDKKRFVPQYFKVEGRKVNFVDALSFIWQYYEIFYKQFYFFETESFQPLIIDCGTNIGMSCIYFKSIYPKAKILAFEADPKIAQVAQENFNKFSYKDIQITAKAVWIHNDTIALNTDGADGASVVHAQSQFHVPCVRLRDVLNAHKEIDFLKMDIEGAEVSVLKDCKDHLAHIKNIFIEYHSFKSETQELHHILQILTDNGFRYTITSVKIPQQPFKELKKKNQPSIDLQLNIFAVKV